MLENILKKVLDEKNQSIDDLSYEKQVEELLRNFNFEHVQYIMSMNVRAEYDESWEHVIKYSPWKMINDNMQFEIPTVEQLMKLATELLEEVIAGDKNSYTFVETGPFRAANRYGHLELQFVMESWSND